MPAAFVLASRMVESDPLSKHSLRRSALTLRAQVDAATRDAFAHRLAIEGVALARRAFARDKFVALLEGGLPAGLWRAKGFFWLAEQPADIGFLSVAGGGVRREWVGTWAAALREGGIVTDAEIPAAARLKWSEPYGDRRQELVFIGTGLDVVTWRAKLDACWA